MNIFISHRRERKEVAYFMQRLYNRGLTTTSGGNISFRINKSLVAITPSQLDKARLKCSDIALMDLKGTNYTTHLKPSIETEMHLSILQVRPDVRAIVHAHPVCATSFACSSKTINVNLIAESFVVTKNPLMAPYAMMGTKQLAHKVSDTFKKTDCVLMQNHGIITVGKTLLEAFDKLEVLEAAAKMTIITDLMKDCSQLSEEQLNELTKNF